VKKYAAEWFIDPVVPEVPEEDLYSAIKPCEFSYWYFILFLLYLLFNVLNIFIGYKFPFEI
jgi:hypothetical protein